MECITWFAPIVPGKLEAWKAFDAEIMGARKAEHDRSRKRMGVTREVVSLMQTPQGDFVCLFHEAEDLATVFRLIATSDDPFDVWFRDGISELHGLTPEVLQGPVPATLYFDYRGEGPVSESARRVETDRTSADTD